MKQSLHPNIIASIDAIASSLQDKAERIERAKDMVQACPESDTHYNHTIKSGPHTASTVDETGE